MDQFNIGALALRLTLGLFLAYHGYNKFFGPGGIKGTVGWFSSIVMKPPKLNAYAAATMEIGAGLMLAAGLLTPFAAAGVIGLMTVAIWVAHRKAGFFIFKPGQGWEYCATIAIAAAVVATIGAGRWSLDNAFGVRFNGWTGLLIAVPLGVGGAIAQLAACYRPAPSNAP